jgi:hypothetical protein
VHSCSVLVLLQVLPDSGKRPVLSLVPSQLMARARQLVLLGPGASLRPIRSRLSVGEATRRCEQAMLGVAATQLQAHVKATTDRRQKVAAEAQEFFHQLPEEWGASLHTACPSLVLWFAMEEWLPSHTGDPAGWAPLVFLCGRSWRCYFQLAL